MVCRKVAKAEAAVGGDLRSCRCSRDFLKALQCSAVEVLPCCVARAVVAAATRVVAVARRSVVTRRSRGGEDVLSADAVALLCFAG